MSERTIITPGPSTSDTASKEFGHPDEVQP
jgi:hypothetical protein